MELGIFILFLVLHLTLLFLSSSSTSIDRNSSVADVGGIFVFGSSLVDNGNNNYLKESRAKANYLPYGIDFPQGPSGRFSNGKTTIDALCELLKFKSHLPPSMNPSTKGNSIVHGVNFASGGSGILDQTGLITGGVISMNQQIRDFEMIVLPELVVEMGGTSSLHFKLSKFLFVVGTGGNDYLNYFLLPISSRPSLHEFTNKLIQELSTQIQKLYNLGGRKFVLLSIQTIGCTPVVKQYVAGHGSCIEPINQAALLFNKHLKKLIHKLKPHLPGSNMVYINSYKIIKDIIDNPNNYGFKEVNEPCCEVSSVKDDGRGILCVRGGSTCSERRSHVFFDGLHPTEAVNVLLANKAYFTRHHSVAYPFNIQHLVRM